MARLFWGRSNTRCCSISSWYYALAAEGNVFLGDISPESEASKYWKEAAQRFHWAANQFRNIGQLDKGIDYYFLSASYYSRLAKTQKDSSSLSRDRQDNLKQARRSLERGMAICNSVGESAVIWNDDGTPSEMKRLIKELAADELEKSYLNFKQQRGCLEFCV